MSRLPIESPKIKRLRHSCPALIRSYHLFREAYSFYRQQHYISRLRERRERPSYGIWEDGRGATPLLAAVNYGFQSPAGTCCFYQIR